MLTISRVNPNYGKKTYWYIAAVVGWCSFRSFYAFAWPSLIITLLMLFDIEQLPICHSSKKCRKANLPETKGSFDSRAGRKPALYSFFHYKRNYKSNRNSTTIYCIANIKVLSSSLTTPISLFNAISTNPSLKEAEWKRGPELHQNKNNYGEGTYQRQKIHQYMAKNQFVNCCYFVDKKYFIDIRFEKNKTTYRIEN